MATYGGKSEYDGPPKWGFGIQVASYPEMKQEINRGKILISSAITLDLNPQRLREGTTKVY